MKFRIYLYLICETFLVCLAYADHSEKDRADGMSNPEKAARDLPKFEIVTTVPEYRVTDDAAYESLRKLGQTKPDIPPDDGVSQFASTWANINVERSIKREDYGDSYVVYIYNEYHLLAKDEYAYRIGFVGLSKNAIRNGIVETRFIGYYDTPKILDRLLDFVCNKAQIKKPNRISPEEQFAPKTTTYYGSGRADDFQTFSDLTKSAKPSPDVAGSSLAVISIAPLQRIVRHEETYRVELFATPGLMRISVEKRNVGADRTLKTLGYITNQIAWLSLRERLDNTTSSQGSVGTPADGKGPTTSTKLSPAPTKSESTEE